MLSLSLGLWPSISPVSPGDPDRYMFFASRARMPSGTMVTALTGTNYVCCKIIVNSPPYATNKFKFHFSGFAGSEGGTSPAETQVTGTVGTPGNSNVIDLFEVCIAGVFYRCKFDGADTFTILDQSTGKWTDELVLPSDLPAETPIELWTFYHTAVGGKQYPVYRIQKHRGERVWGASDLASLVAFKSTPLATSTAALDINDATIAQPQYYGPDFMVAKGWDGRPVALCVVDSIGEARQEISAAADMRGNLGWLRRWLDAPPQRIPHLMIGYPGAASFRELTGSGSSIATRRWDVLDQITAMNGGKWPFTLVANQMGQNDTTAPYATWWSRYLGLVTRLRARYTGVRIVAFPPLGRTDQMQITLTSVGSLATATCPSTAHLTTGQLLTISGAAPTAYNGAYVITVTGPTTFEYSFAGGTSPATGTIRASDLYLSPDNQVFSANNVYPAAAGDDATGKWLLRNDILAKTSACCDEAIDTFAAWSDPVAPGKWPAIVWDGVLVDPLPAAGWTSARIAASRPPLPEDILTIGITGIVCKAVADNGDGTYTVTDSSIRTIAASAGTPCQIRVSPDGVHPNPSSVDRIWRALPQSEKAKLG